MTAAEQDEQRAHVVVVDLETTGLDPDNHVVVEAAWWNLDTDERGTYVVPHEWRKIAAGAAPAALNVHRYLERELWRREHHDTTGAGAYAFAEQLGGNILAGANPRFDESFLVHACRHILEAWTKGGAAAIYRLHHMPELASHRLVDVEAYAAGRLGLWHLAPLPSLRDITRALGVPQPDHTAEADVTAAGEALRLLRSAQTRELLLGDRATVRDGRLVFPDDLEAST